MFRVREGFFPTFGPFSDDSDLSYPEGIFDKAAAGFRAGVLAMMLEKAPTQ